MTPAEHADVWRKVSDRLEEHAAKPNLGPTDARTLAGLSLFAWEISQAYRLDAAAKKFPEAFADK